MTLLPKSIFDTPRRAVYLSNDKLTVYHWKDGKLGSSYLFDDSEDGRRYFDRYLKESPKLTTYMLVDVVEEEFRQDKVPHVRGSDHKSVIERKKNRMFRDTPYFHAEVQGREEEGRKDDRVLFMALTNPDIIEPWIRLLDDNKVPLAGIYSLPQVTRIILKNLEKPPSDHQLLVSLQSISGLRQTFFQKGKMKISRLVGLPRYGTEPYAPIINEEVELIQRYLNSLRLIDTDNPLDIYYLGDRALLDELDRIQTDSQSMRHHRVDLAEYCRREGIDTEITNPFSDHVYVYHLLKKKPKNTYAVNRERRYFKLKAAKQFMYAASAFMFIAGFVWSGLNLMEGLLNKQKSIVAEKKTEFYTVRYQSAQDQLKQTEVSPRNLKVVTEVVDTLRQYKADPFDMYSIVSKGLDSHPYIEIDEIDWMTSTSPEINQANITGNTVPVGMTRRPGNTTENEKDYTYYHIGEVKGHIADFNGDYRKAINTIESFRDQINSMADVYNVSVTDLPLDVSPEKSLQGTSKRYDGRAAFSMKIILGVSNEPS